MTDDAIVTRKIANSMARGPEKLVRDATREEMIAASVRMARVQNVNTRLLIEDYIKSVAHRPLPVISLMFFESAPYGQGFWEFAALHGVTFTNCDTQAASRQGK